MLGLERPLPSILIRRLAKNIHSFPVYCEKYPASTPVSLGSLLVLAESADLHSQLTSSRGGYENKMRLGLLANVCDPGHCATLPLQEILWVCRLPQSPFLVETMGIILDHPGFAS